VPADLIHLVRHGEVHNPTGVLYGRIPGFHLSELGRAMAQASADAFAGRNITALFASPLERTQESAAPWASATSLPIQSEERIIEPSNRFEGGAVRFPQLLAQPRVWPWVINPVRPSWGEAYASIAKRMDAAMRDANSSVESGEVVMVSHQLPIWMVARTANGKRLFHDARKRRCSLSSVTTFRLTAGRFVEVDYAEPARGLLAASEDKGAV
jgi:broad specificity phosphatase PhoE